MKIIPQVLAIALSFWVVEYGKAMDEDPSKSEKSRKVSHRKKPLRDFRYFSLELGLKDPTSANAANVKSIYGKEVLEYYDCDPSSKKKLPSFDQISGEKALPFSKKGCENWLRVRDEKVKEYDAALRRWKEAERKLKVETAAWNAANPHAAAALDELTNDLLTSVESLSDLSGLEDRGRDTPEPDQEDQIVVVEKKVNLDTTLFNQARQACQEAKDDFERLLKKLLAEHPLSVVEDEQGERIFVLRDRRQLEELIYDQNLKRLLRNPKQLTLLQSTPVDLEDRKNRVRGFTIDEPYEIQFYLAMIKGRNQRLEHLLKILTDCSVRFHRDYRPNVKHVFSLYEFKDWYYGTTYLQVQKDFANDWSAPPSLANYPLPESASHEEVTRRLLRRDKVGMLMKAKFLDAIIRYVEPVGDLARLDSDNDGNHSEIEENYSCKKPFSQIYQGDDVGNESTLGVDESINDETNPKREYLREYPTKFFNDTTRYYREKENDPLLVFHPPHKAQMVEMVRHPETLRFHRTHWHKVTREVLERAKERAKANLVEKNGKDMSAEYITTAKQYAEACERYRKLLGDVTRKFEELQEKPPASLLPSLLPTLLPAPIELLYIRSESQPILPVPIERKEGIVLRDLQLTDTDLNTLCFRPYADRGIVVFRGEPVLGHYDCLDLANNLIAEPFKFPLGFAFQNTLVSLDLSYNRLKNFNFLPSLKALRTFNGSGNTLILELPVWGEGQGILLEELNISHINLKEVHSLCFLINLKVLDISYTNVEDLNSLSVLEKLVTLNVSKTRVKDLKVIGTLQALEELSASECLMEGSWKECVPSLPNLKTLELRKNNIKWFPYMSLDRARKALSSSDNVTNDGEFNKAFPNLVFLGAEDEYLEGKIILGDLKSNPLFFGK